MPCFRIPKYKSNKSEQLKIQFAAHIKLQISITQGLSEPITYSQLKYTQYDNRVACNHFLYR